MEGNGERAQAGRAQGAADVRLRSDYCVFERGGVTFAISTRVAREVLDWRPFTPLPRSPDGLLGAFNLRGEVVPVVRLDRFLGVPEKALERTDPLLVLVDGDLALAAFVDRVDAVRHIPPWEIQRSDPAERQRNPLLRGTTGKNPPAAILDGERLLAAVAGHIATGFHRGPGGPSPASRGQARSSEPASQAELESIGR